LCFCLIACGKFFSEDEPMKKSAADVKKYEYVLLPVPRRLDYLPGTHKLGAGRLSRLNEGLSSGLLDGVSVTVDPQSVPQPQGCRLVITAEQIRVTAHDQAGAFYAAQTLKQIFRQAENQGELACVQITDWPDFANRGVMLDISRDKVPTMQTLYELVDLLSEWKLNQFQLYTEHTFAYCKHRRVWKDASPMTAEQVRALDEYCRRRFIELVPNQNSFGHMARWLKHKSYQHLAEVPQHQLSSGMEHNSLCPIEPASIGFIEGLYDELLPNFSSRQFNVGCDETSDLGQGRSRQDCERTGAGRVYLDFLLKIYSLAKQRGRTIQFWGDIILKHPELISELPKDVIALVWGYEAEHPFAEQCPKFAASGIPFYVCPGTSTWNSIAGRTDNAVANLSNAARNGLACGACGYLITNWGDNGHWQPLPVCYLGFAYGAALSWAGEVNRDVDIPRVLDVHAFRDSAGVMGRLIYDLGNAYKQPNVLIHNHSVLFDILFEPENFQEDLTIESLERTRSFIDEVISALPQARMNRPDARQISDEVSNAAALLRHACSLGIARLKTGDGKISSIPKKVREELAVDLEKIISEHKRLWLLRNRKGGLADSTSRMEKLLKLYKDN
jgi:hexosaminidase